MQSWITELKQLGPQNIVLAIAGNKSDLEQQRKVRRTLCWDWAELGSHNGVVCVHVHVCACERACVRVHVCVNECTCKSPGISGNR